MRRKHQNLRFQNCSRSKGQVNCHLVSVKVSVECGTSQGVKLNSLALDHTGLECLNSQSVQRRSSVQKYRVPLHYVFKDVPNNRFALVDDFFS